MNYKYSLFKHWIVNQRKINQEKYRLIKMENNEIKNHYLWKNIEETAKEAITKAIQENKAAGPKPITIEEYKRRQEGKTKRENFKTPEPKPETQKKPRGGKKVKLRQRVAEIFKILPLADKPKQKILKEELRMLRDQLKSKNKNINKA